MLESIHSFSQHKTNKLAQRVFQVLSQKSFLSPTSLKKKFVNQDYQVTQLFWDTFYRLYPNEKYNSIEYCSGCNKFDMYYEEREEEKTN